MRTWTEAARTAQREAIKRWQPWAKSTGPRTFEGKQRSAANARKLDRSSIKEQRLLKTAFSAQTEARKAFQTYKLWQNKEKSEKRTIMLVYLRSVFKAADRAFYKAILSWCDLCAFEEDQKPALPLLFEVKNMRMAA